MQANAMFWDSRAQKYDEEIQRHDSLYAKTMTKWIDSTNGPWTGRLVTPE